MKQTYVKFICADDEDGKRFVELFKVVDERDIYKILVPKNALQFCFFDLVDGKAVNYSALYTIGRFIELEKLEKMLTVYNYMDILVKNIKQENAIGGIKLRYSNLWMVYTGQELVDLP